MLARQLCDFQRIQTSIAKKTYIIVNVRGGGGGPDPLFLPLDPHLIDPVFMFSTKLLIDVFTGSVMRDDKHRKSEPMRF